MEENEEERVVLTRKLTFYPPLELTDHMVENQFMY